MANYNTVLSVSGVDCDCEKISLTDDSIWDNTTVGHKLSTTVPAPSGYANSFGYRKIIITKPDGIKYVMSSLSTETKDRTITTLSPTGVINFDYSFLTTDEDGIYTINLYNFPTWNSTAAYLLNKKNIVFYNGILYEQVSNSTNNNPASDTTFIYWKPYTITTATDLTKYGVTYKLVVLCRKIMGCYRDFIYAAFCGSVSNPCEDKIKNKDFNTAMKLQVIMEALDIASCENDWEAVADMITMLKQITSSNASC